MSEIYTPEEIAAKLKLNINTIWRYLKSGKLPSSKIGNRYRITEEQLQQFMLATSASIRIRDNRLKTEITKQDNRSWAELTQEERDARLDAVQGMFARSSRTVDDFLREKHEEVEEEERRWEERHRK
jgi:excisionase family DNA binding protein